MRAVFGRAICSALLAAGLLWLGSCQRGETPSAPFLRASIEPDSGAAVGDQIILNLTAAWPELSGAARISWHPHGDSLIAMSADSSASKARSGWRSAQHTITLICARAGEVNVPGGALISARGDTIAVSPPLRVAIKGRISAADQAQLSPLAPMVGLGGVPWLLIAIAAAVAALIGVLFLWRARRRRALLAAAPPPVPPGEEFDRAYEALLRRGLPEPGLVRAFVQEVSWIFRRYLGRRWLHPALEATRPEIVRWLPDVPITIQERNALGAWLEDTDRIKFAGYEPPQSETQDVIRRARKMVDRMEAQAREAEAAAALARAEKDRSAADKNSPAGANESRSKGAGEASGGGEA